jgi:hypothetical protein
MILDDAVVFPGDSVYDLIRGVGKVKHVRTDSFDVEFITLAGNSVVVKYAPNGVHNNMKRLYWRDPIIIAPPKSASRWEYHKLATKKILELIQQAV